MASVTGFLVSPAGAVRHHWFGVRAVLSSESGTVAAVNGSSSQNGSLALKEEKKVPLLRGEEEEEGLAALWDDGYGRRSVEDYFAAAKEMCKSDGGPPRWFCPLECGPPFKDSPTLLFLPGMDGTGLGLTLHHKALGKAFEVRCLHIPVHDRTPFEGLCSLTAGETCWRSC